MVDDTIALQVKPPSFDLTGAANALSQLNISDAHGALYGQQAAYQGMRLNALRAFSDNLSRGLPIEQAVAPLSAVDPAAAEQALKNSQLGTTLSSNRGYAAGDVNALKAQGAPAYQAGLGARQTEREQGANVQYSQTGDPGSQRIAGPAKFGEAQTAAKTGVDINKGQLDLWGQAGNAILAGVKPDGTLDPAAKTMAFSIAKQAGANPLQLAQYANAPDSVIIQMGRQLSAGGQTAAGYADTSGMATTAKETAKAPFEKITKDATQTIEVGPGLAAGMQLGAPQGAAPQPRASARTPSPPIFAQIEQQNRLPAGYMKGTIGIENPKGDPNAFNTSSKAAGLGQFIPSTWAQYGGGKSPFDPAASLDATGRYGADNQKTFVQATGQQPTAAQLYLMHQQGPGGALKLLANPTARAGDLVGNAAIRANGGDPDAPASAFTNMWTGRFNTIAGGPSTTPFGGRALVMPPQAQGAQPGPEAPQQAPATPSPVMPIPGAPGAAIGALAGAGGPLPPAQAPAQAAAPAPAPIPAPQPIPAAPAPVQAPPAAVPPVAPISTGGGQAPQPIVNAGGGVTLPGMSLEQKAAAEARGKGLMDAQVKQFAEAKEAYGNAASAQLNLNQLQKTLSAMPSTGMLTAGSGATERLGLAKGINTALAGFGLAAAFDPAAIASAEESQKITGKLGFDMSRALGSREAAQIVRQAIGLNPGIESTPEGGKVVAASINAGLQRQKDWYQFLSQNGNAPDADIQFNKTHPVAQYVKEAQALAKIPQKAVDLLQEHPTSSSLSAYFDKNYGAGLSRYYTGQ